jgi:hypothetical protein
MFSQGISTDFLEKAFCACPVQGIRFTINCRQLIDQEVLSIRAKEEHGMEMVQEGVVGQCFFENRLLADIRKPTDLRLNPFGGQDSPKAVFYFL